MIDKDRALESLEETLQWVVAGTVAAMTVTVAKGSNGPVAVVVVVVVAVLIGSPVNYLVKWMADQGRE